MILCIIGGKINVNFLGLIVRHNKFEEVYICMVNSKKYSIILIVVGVLVVLGAMIYFYWSKLVHLVDDPRVFLKLFMDASQISKFSFRLVLIGLMLSSGAMLIDLMVLGWNKSGLRRLLVNPSGSARIDLWCYFLSVFKIYEVLYFVLTMGVFYFIAGIFPKTMNVNLSQYIADPYWQFLFVFVLTDFKHYIGHRFMHIRPFWELHAYHHSATEFNLFTTARGHLIEAGIYYVFTGIFFALLGVPIMNVFLVYAFREFYQYLLHSDVNWSLGIIGKIILVSPAAHRLHHSIESEDYNKNYGTFFIWWDRLLGTFAEPKAFYKIGISDNPYNEVGFLKGQWIGFKRFLGLKEKEF